MSSRCSLRRSATRCYGRPPTCGWPSFPRTTAGRVPFGRPSLAQEQAKALVDDARKELASATRLAVLAAIPWALGILTGAEAISAVLKALHLR